MRKSGVGLKKKQLKHKITIMRKENIELRNMIDKLYLQLR